MVPPVEAPTATTRLRFMGDAGLVPERPERAAAANMVLGRGWAKEARRRTWASWASSSPQVGPDGLGKTSTAPSSMARRARSRFKAVKEERTTTGIGR